MSINCLKISLVYTMKGLLKFVLILHGYTVHGLHGAWCSQCCLLSSSLARETGGGSCLVPCCAYCKKY